MTPGKVTGGGQIEAPNPVTVKKKIVDTASFGFNVMYDEGYPAPKGELEYLDHATKMNVHAHDMTKLVVSPDKTQAWFEGTCTIDGVSGYTFEAYVEDNNEPGKKDVFEITLSTGYKAGGELLNGNIQIHKKP
ncbi:MAG: post-COAP-1 domain-containing protein [archaeon]|nr:post-COAP-1 domain-containing protein [archaeon]